MHSSLVTSPVIQRLTVEVHEDPGKGNVDLSNDTTK